MTEEIPLCPPWWPRLVWDLHQWPHPPGGGPGPINFPPAIHDMMAAVSIHSLSYWMLDQEEAARIRHVAEGCLSTTASQLSELHERGATT